MCTIWQHWQTIFSQYFDGQNFKCFKNHLSSTHAAYWKQILRRAIELWTLFLNLPLCSSLLNVKESLRIRVANDMAWKRTILERLHWKVVSYDLLKHFQKVRSFCSNFMHDSCWLTSWDRRKKYYVLEIQFRQWFANKVNSQP